MIHLSPSVVFFDAVGTLFKLRAPVGEMYLKQARRHGFSRQESDLAEKLTDSFRRAFRAQGPLAFPGEPAGRIPDLERRWWKDVVSRTFSPFGAFPDFDRFFEDVYAFFRMGEPWQLEPEAAEVLAQLKIRGKRLGLITNYDSRVIDVLECLSIKGFLDTVMVSSLAGAAKPDARIFREACSRLGCRVEQAVHVGDDPHEDLEGAREAGLKALLYDPGLRFAAANPWRITRLAELAEILV